MLKFLCKRILHMIPVFLILTFALFFLANLCPGSPADILASEGEMTAEQYEALRHDLGLDRPIIVRYAEWLGNMLTGDMGVSTRTYQSVWTMLKERIGPTLLLTMTALLIALVIAVPLGIISAYKPYSIWDNISTFIAFVGSSAPAFLIALLGVYFFSVILGWLPATGMFDTNGDRSIGDLLRHLILPATVVSLNQLGSLLKQTRGGLLEVLNEEYIKTARANGLSEFKVVVKHGFRNAMVPLVTQISLRIPLLIGGSIVIENIFSWPGMGSLLLTSITGRDYNAIMGVTTLICIVVLCFNILLDIVYGILDPRISQKS